MSNSHKILVTGSAGFIGHHLVLALQEVGYQIVGLDSINSYYDVDLKTNRLALQGFDKEDISPSKLITSTTKDHLSFIQLNLSDEKALAELFKEQKFDVVINLAAQAGVRYSIDNPQSYVTSNLVGFFNIIECCRQFKIKHFLFASSSSVYGLNPHTPFRNTDTTDFPISFYAATKKSNEAMAHSYAHLYQIPTTGLRFFTVYGPWGRPDMAYYKFTQAIQNGETIKIFNNGDMQRDFTYIDDVVNSIIKLIDHPALPGNFSELSTAPYKIFNIGNSRPEPLMKFVEILERLLDKKAVLEHLPMQPGDVLNTFAEVSDLDETIGFRPSTSLEKGLGLFVDWYLEYYR